MLQKLQSYESVVEWNVFIYLVQRVRWKIMHRRIRKKKNGIFQKKIHFHVAQQPTKYIEVWCNKIEWNESFYQCQFYIKNLLQWKKNVSNSCLKTRIRATKSNPSQAESKKKWLVIYAKKSVSFLLFVCHFNICENSPLHINMKHFSFWMKTELFFF